MLAEAKRPVLYVGGGVIRSHASEELLELAEATNAPVVTTLMARGAFPDSHQQHLGMPGMHGTVPAVIALQEADLLVALGARFDDRVTGKSALFAPNAKVVHVDIDPAEISKIRTADVPIVGDAEGRARRPARRLPRGDRRRRRPTSRSGGRRSTGCAREFPLGFTRSVRRPARAAVRHPAHRRAHRPRGRLRRGRRPAPDVGGAVHQVRAPELVAELGRRRHDGLRGARGHGRQGRPARPGRVGDRRRRMLPDDQPGARHLHAERHPDQGRDHQQLVARHGAPVADAVLRRPLLEHRPQHRARHSAHPRLRRRSPRRTAHSASA